MKGSLLKEFINELKVAMKLLLSRNMLSSFVVSSLRNCCCRSDLFVGFFTPPKRTLSTGRDPTFVELSTGK